MNVPAAQPPDSVYIDFLKKVYPNNPEYHKIPEGLVKFAEDNYPTEKIMHKPDTVKRIIRNKLDRGISVEKPASKYSKYVRKTISQLLAEEMVEVTGVIAERLPYFSYQGCSNPKCGKKQCEHSDPKVPLFFHQFKLMDDTGEIKISFKSDNAEYAGVDSGDKVRVYGKVKRYKEELNISVYDIHVTQRLKIPETPPNVEAPKLLSSAGIDRLVAELKEFSKIPQKVFEARVMQEGLTLDDLKDKVKLTQDENGAWYTLAQ